MDAECTEDCDMQRSDNFNNILGTSFAWCIPVAASAVLRFFLDHFGVDGGVSHIACNATQIVGAVACLVGTVYAWN